MAKIKKSIAGKIMSDIVLKRANYYNNKKNKKKNA